MRIKTMVDHNCFMKNCFIQYKEALNKCSGEINPGVPKGGFLAPKLLIIL